MVSLRNEPARSPSRRPHSASVSSSGPLPCCVLIHHERYDRIVAAAASNNGDGFSADDVAWLLDRAPGEIVILRTRSRA
jgi:hypothetical protein